MAYRELTGSDSWDFEKNKVLEGILTLKETSVGTNDSNRYHFKSLDDESDVAIWGSAVIDRLLATVDTGSQLKLTYKGKVKNPKTGREYKDFLIEVNDSEESVD